jgi:predicted secreted protein
MGVTTGIVLFAVIWFMTFFVVLPIRVRTQGDVGRVVPGTPAGSPENHNLKKKAWITTGIACLLWIVVASTLISGAITLRDIDMFNRMGPETTTQTTPETAPE